MSYSVIWLGANPPAPIPFSYRLGAQIEVERQLPVFLEARRADGVEIRDDGGEVLFRWREKGGDGPAGISSHGGDRGKIPARIPLDPSISAV